MGHGIQEYDLGFVFGDTWHGLEQYKTLDRPVTYAEAQKVMDYPLELAPLYRKTDTTIVTPDGGIEIHDDLQQVKAWSIVRTDHDLTLVPAVGSRFTLMQNSALLGFIKENLLDAFPDLEIESVGTLFNGATSFLNLKVSEYHIRGDESPTLDRLMYANPLGRSRYRACAHTIRVVCNNTLRAATAEGAANKSLSMIRHTANAHSRLKEVLVDLATIRLGLDTHRQMAEALTHLPVTTEYLNDFLDQIFLVEEKKPEGRALANIEDRQADIIGIFEDGEYLTPEVRTSRYGLLQAVTQHYGTFKAQANVDDAKMAFDNIMGYRANSKARAFDLLCEVAS